VIKEDSRGVDGSRPPESLLLAEANQWPEDVAAYFDDGVTMTTGLSLSADAATSTVRIAQEVVLSLNESCGRLRNSGKTPRALFCRNHDELTLKWSPTRSATICGPLMRANAEHGSISDKGGDCALMETTGARSEM